MIFQELKARNLLLFECISGSRAYGLDTPQSDTDIRGVFFLPKNDFFGLEYTPQLNNQSNDITYYELKRFVELLAKNNPNMLELLFMPKDCILYQHSLFEKFQKINFLSKLCKETFAGYALTQVKKARGLNKKILNPLPEKRKTILEFCHVTQQNGSIALTTWLENHQFKQENCGLANISNMRDIYALFYDTSGQLGFKGVFQNENSNDVSLSHIPKGELPLTYLSFNKDGYSFYCKEYLLYWDWVGKRNEVRYENTLSHGKNYDAKNLMHTFRLLAMAEEIAKEGKINVRRPDRDFLLKIRSGVFQYDDLLQIAEEKIDKLEELFAQSNLPEMPNVQEINAFLVEMREEILK